MLTSPPRGCCLSSLQDKESLVKVSMVVTPEEETLQKAAFEVTWTDEESGVAKKAKKVWLRSYEIPVPSDQNMYLVFI